MIIRKIVCLQAGLSSLAVSKKYMKIKIRLLQDYKSYNVHSVYVADLDEAEGLVKSGRAKYIEEIPKARNKMMTSKTRVYKRRKLRKK